jgi:hypothetical protein
LQIILDDPESVSSAVCDAVQLAVLPVIVPLGDVTNVPRDIFTNGNVAFTNRNLATVINLSMLI